MITATATAPEPVLRTLAPALASLEKNLRTWLEAEHRYPVSTLTRATLETIAEASFARPTTRDPVVYFHESVQSHRLDPALQYCRLAQHDRPSLEQKII